jgi:Protein of unknown function (DUF4199)
MKKTILIYGLISGTITAGMLLSTMSLYKSETLNLDNGELIGYTSMVIALSLIFFAIKTIRDKHQNGSITFWQGCKVGLLITLIASIMYAMSWEISYANMGPEFTKKMQDHYFDKMKEDGLSDAELEKEKEKMAMYMEYYKNPVIRFGVTIMEILPVGVIITLICAGLMRNKGFLPSTDTSTAPSAQ